MHSDDWDNLRYLLAVARHGSVSSAARALGVNHSTVLRHVAAFETLHGVRIFDRRPSGYRLTEHGADILDPLLSVESAVAAVQRRIAAGEERLAGKLRVTTTDSVFAGVLSPHLAGFHARHPHITLDMRVTNLPLNLAQRDADIALRPSRAPPDALVGVHVGVLSFGIYAAPAYLAGQPDRHLNEHAWLGLDEVLARAPPAQWMRDALGEVSTVFRADSFVTLQLAAEAGLGLAVLPCCIADPSPRLVPVRAPMTELDTGLWLLTHPDLRRSSLVRAFLGHFSEVLRGDAGAEPV